MAKDMIRGLTIAATLITTQAAADTQRLGLDVGTVRDVVLGSSHAAEIEVFADRVRVTARSGTAEDVPIALDGLADSEVAISIVDIDRDGIRDLSIPTSYGYGGVNIFHTILLTRPGTPGGLSMASDVSNPDFNTPSPGFVASMRSGPTWVAERWDIQSNGQPFLHTSQVATFSGYDARQVFNSSGHVVEETVVPEALSLYAPAVPVYAFAPDTGLRLSNGVHVRAGARLRLVRFDADAASVLVQAVRGETGWTTEELRLAQP